MTSEVPVIRHPDHTAGDYLVVEGLGKVYTRKTGKESEFFHAFQDVDFAVKRGEFMVIVGPSGCGKTTVLRCIGGLLKYEEGSIRLDGELITSPGPERAIVFQHSSLLPWRSLERNVSYSLELRRELPKTIIRERVAAALEMVGLSSFSHSFPNELSGGMMQRANMARALVVEPELLLMDEPFGALDAMTREKLQQDVVNLAALQGRTTIFITHDIEEAVFLGDRILLMEIGSKGGGIRTEVQVPFERPRMQEIKLSAEFQQLVFELKNMLHVNSML
jgi:NitT/TauT family transport system ATP-binding protein